MGPSPDHNDNMILDWQNNASASGFGHPSCKGGTQADLIIRDLSRQIPTGPKRRLTRPFVALLGAPRKQDKWTIHLSIYLHDHMAGSHFAIKLLDSLQEQYRREPLGEFAVALKADVKQDQDTLQKIIDRVGKSGVDLTEAIGWLAEKVSQLKLKRDDSSDGIGTFEALETLLLGIRGKLCLWQALPLIRELDARIPEQDFDSLRSRAQDQYARVEVQHLKMVRPTFSEKRPSE